MRSGEAGMKGKVRGGGSDSALDLRAGCLRQGFCYDVWAVGRSLRLYSARLGRLGYIFRDRE